MLEITLLGALFAGLLSFFTPCVLPMVPFYLSYMGGLTVGELRDDGGIVPGAQRRLLVSAISFAAGVTSVFMLLGMGATALGQLFGQYLDSLSYVAAAILLIFGLHFLGVIQVPMLYREARLESRIQATTVGGAYMMGLAFGFGWTPCVGPALAAILMIASGLGDIWRGALLLMVYGIGMTFPFVLAALFARPFLAWASRHRSLVVMVEKAMGAMLILFAALIATGGVQWIAYALLGWLPGASALG
ncbi:cytochrome c biogenesis CcdA family protein [Parasedimentitalea huanghaiensis]|uniref:Cytochrome c biogenesis protein CcdA n=1 Tax=Parasedimentitalea huanghaiensis TaxID=2682100 RepID=A0A6L6WJW3_9RHOB|nr:cytochrome c biogenesis protein CcdA [Zongyanglinia huanghaiensis]MVO17458.1 cytochrome c biogenesis protein CcdA [Zongyanglinia huanghaiensis]